MNPMNSLADPNLQLALVNSDKKAHQLMSGLTKQMQYTSIQDEIEDLTKQAQNSSNEKVHKLYFQYANQIDKLQTSEMKVIFLRHLLLQRVATKEEAIKLVQQPDIPLGTYYIWPSQSQPKFLVFCSKISLYPTENGHPILLDPQTQSVTLKLLSRLKGENSEQNSVNDNRFNLLVNLSSCAKVVEKDYENSQEEEEAAKILEESKWTNDYLMCISNIEKSISENGQFSFDDINILFKTGNECVWQIGEFSLEKFKYILWIHRYPKTIFSQLVDFFNHGKICFSDEQAQTSLKSTRTLKPYDFRVCPSSMESSKKRILSFVILLPNGCTSTNTIQIMGDTNFDLKSLINTQAQQ